MAVEKKLYTVEEFDAFQALPENRDRNFELINGEIVEKVPTQKHGIITVNIVSEIRGFSKARKLERVAVEVRHQIPDDDYNSRQPDITYYADTASPVVERGPMMKIFDLGVEVKSPDQTYTEMREKAAYYLANGARMVWLVYPEKRLVEIYQPDADVQILTEDDVIDGGDVLPGFKLPLRDIFA